MNKKQVAYTVHFVFLFLFCARIGLGATLSEADLQEKYLNAYALYESAEKDKDKGKSAQAKKSYLYAADILKTIKVAEPTWHTKEVNWLINEVEQQIGNLAKDKDSAKDKDKDKKEELPPVSQPALEPAVPEDYPKEDEADSRSGEQISIINKQNQALENEITEKERIIEDLKSSLTYLERKNAEQQKLLQAKKEGPAIDPEAIKKITEENQVLKTTIEELETKITKDKTRFKDLEEECRLLHKQYEEAKEQLQSLPTQDNEGVTPPAATAEAGNDRLNEANLKLDEYRTTIMSLKEENQKLKDELTEKNDASLKEQAPDGRLNEANLKLDEYRTTITSLKEENQKLKDELTEKNDASLKEQPPDDERVKAYQEQIKRLNENYLRNKTVLEKSLEDAQASVSSLKQEKEDLIKENKELEIKLSLKEAENLS